MKEFLETLEEMISIAGPNGDSVDLDAKINLERNVKRDRREPEKKVVTVKIQYLVWDD